MNKDLLLLALFLVVVLVAGAAFFFFVGGDSGEPDFVATGAEQIEDEDAPTRTRRVEQDRPADDGRAEGTTAATTGAEPVAGEAGEGSATVFGRVLDPDGRPVPQATVALCLDVSQVVTQSLQGDVVSAVVSGEGGEFEIIGISVDERYLLRVDEATYATEFVPTLAFAPDERKRIDVRLSAGLHIAGKVTDLEGAPLKDVEVMAFDQQNRADDPTLAVERSVFTDADGNFAFTSLRPGLKNLTARKPGYASESKRTITLLGKKKVADVEFKLGPGARILGVVSDAATKQPIENMIVSAVPTARGPRSSAVSYRPVKSDADGRFIFEGLRAGSYKLRFSGSGYGRTGTLLLARTIEEEQSFELTRMPVARGRVIDEETGQPVERFKIFLGRQEQLVVASQKLSQRFDDPEGRFEFVDVGDKHDFYLFAVVPGYAGGRSERLSPVEGSDIEGVEIRVYRGCEVAGKVVDSDGKGVAGATVSVVPVLGGATTPAAGLRILGALQKNMRTDSRKTRTGRDGAFTVVGLPEGVFKMVVSHESFAETETDERFTVPRSGRLDLDDVVMMRGGVLTGTVRDENGDPAPNARVTLTENGNFGGNTYHATCDATGSYRIDRIRPGIYVVKYLEVGATPDLGKIFGEALGNSQRRIVLGDGDVEKMDLP